MSSVEWCNEWSMVNRKGFVSKRLWLNQGNIAADTLPDFRIFRLTEKTIEK